MTMMERPAANANDDSVSLVDECRPPRPLAPPPRSPPPLVVLDGLVITPAHVDVNDGNGHDNGRC